MFTTKNPYVFSLIIHKFNVLLTTYKRQGLFLSETTKISIQILVIFVLIQKKQKNTDKNELDYFNYCRII